MSGLGVNGLSVWLPRRGTVLDGVDLAIPSGSLALLIGRIGSGHSTLLNALAGQLPAGAVFRGRVTIDGHPTAGYAPTELAGAVRLLGDRPLPDLTVRELVHRARDQVVADLGLTAVLDRRPSQLDPGTRAAVRIAHAVGDPGCRLLLLDQVLGPLPAELRPVAVRAVLGAARRGTTVLWAEHLIEYVVAEADLVVESLPGGERRLSQARQWAPRTVPAPPLMALARALGLPREQWFDRQAVAQHRAVRDALAGTGNLRRSAGDTVAVVGGADLGLADQEVELRYGEPLGVVTAHPGDGRELLLARRLLQRISRMSRTPLAGTAVDQSGASVAAICQVWERRHQLPPGVVADRLADLAALRLPDPLAQHSAGERAALRWALESAKPGPRLFVEPTGGLDPAFRRALAEGLAGDATAVTLVVSSDVEFLVRGCRRLLVVDGDRLVGDGAPAAVLQQLPALPQIAELCAPRPVTRVRECLGTHAHRRLL